MAIVDARLGGLIVERRRRNEPLLIGTLVSSLRATARERLVSALLSKGLLRNYLLLV